MRRFLLLCFLLTTTLFCDTEIVSAQCAVDTNVSGIYNFNAPDGPGIYEDFLCDDVDSLGTKGFSGYYDGDGYVIKLIAGTAVTFSIDSCTGNPASLTLADSSNTIIPGAYSASACPNTLAFTATYTGEYIIVINKDGICGGGLFDVIGQVYVRIDTGQPSIPCPSESNIINDTLCGAINLMVDSGSVAGNTSVASVTDPADQEIMNLGYACSPPNSTLWYTFTALTSAPDSALEIIITSDTGSLFSNWIAVFKANDPSDPCDVSGLNYVGCALGSDDVNNINRVAIPFPSVSAGDVFYIMIDGFQGSAGGFTIAIQTWNISTGINLSTAENTFSLYPNPANNFMTIENRGMKGAVNVRLLNSLGQVVLNKSYYDFEKETLDISNQPPGIYFVRVVADNKSYDEKIVKR